MTATLRAKLEELAADAYSRDQTLDRLEGLAIAAAQLALDAAIQAITDAEQQERARVEATDERGPIWANSKAMSSGIYHAGIYMRSAIRSLDVGGKAGAMTDKLTKKMYRTCECPRWDCMCQPDKSRKLRDDAEESEMRDEATHRTDDLDPSPLATKASEAGGSDLEARLSAAMVRPDGPQIRPNGAFAYTWSDILAASSIGAEAERAKREAAEAKLATAEAEIEPLLRELAGLERARTLAEVVEWLRDRIDERTDSFWTPASLSILRDMAEAIESGAWERKR